MTHSEEVRRKISQSCLGRPSPCGFAGKKHSEETKKRIALAGTGKRNVRWCGGISPIYERIRKLRAYKEWRTDIFTKCDYTCVVCGTRGGQLNADHFPVSFSKIVHENRIKSVEDAKNCEHLWDRKNGRVLCLACHRNTPNYAGRSYRNGSMSEP